jgi:hypothetical protein
MEVLALLLFALLIPAIAVAVVICVCAASWYNQSEKLSLAKLVGLSVAVGIPAEMLGQG